MDHEDHGVNGVRQREKKETLSVGHQCEFMCLCSACQFRMIPTEVTEVPVSSATWPSCVDGTNARKVNS